MLSLKWLLLYLHTLGALVLRADVNIWQLSHKNFMEDESLGFEKKYRKNLFGPVLLDDSNRHKDKATSLRFSCTRLLLLWKAAYLPENKKST
ncbi:MULTISPECIES: hypothetical protein [unclassified Bartonella]|uniref:hypothetical protein n=1 Tax=unclassified Bartonella TaxID=2645622 RepID=UPI0035CEC4C3